MPPLQLTRSILGTIPRRPVRTRQSWPSRSYQSSAQLLAYKHSQDRESLKPDRGENTKSGQDGDAASQSDAAFNPNETDPQKEKNTAGEGAESNPLEVSGANQGVSKPQGDEKTGQKRGAGKETQKGGASGSGDAPKSKKG
jgi:hypothetical protein